MLNGSNRVKKFSVVWLAVGWAALMMALLAPPAAQAAITFVGSVAKDDNDDALKINRPAGVQSGDLLIAQIAVRGDAAVSITPPAGWTLLRRDTAVGGSPPLSVALYTKTAGSSEPGNYTWTFAGKRRAAGIIAAYRGASGIDAHGGQATNTASSLITAPSVTATVAGDRLLAFFAQAHGNAKLTEPAGMSRRERPRSGGGKNGVSALAADQTLAAAGSTGPRTAESNRSAIGVGQLVALIPAGAAVVPGGFNAFETTTPPGAITGVLKTKVAASPFSFDIVAVNPQKTGVFTTFTGSVKIELLDAADDSAPLDAHACRGSWTVIQRLPDQLFTPLDQGRRTVSNVVEPNAWPKVRVRVTFPAIPVIGSPLPLVVGCSTDAFAIRPAAFAQVAVTDQNWETAGATRALANTSATGGVVHKAGRPFRVYARAVNAAGATTTRYAGSPEARMEACLQPAGCGLADLGVLNIGAPASNGVLEANGATYDEAGAFSMRLVDADFAAVDAPDSSSAEREIQSATIDVGRFVPDRFELAPQNTPQLKTFNDTGCSGRFFTYIGQPFGYVTAPQAKVEAKNAAGSTTANYRGTLWKLTATDVTQTYTSVPATPVLTTTLGAPTVTSDNDGTGTIAANAGDTLNYTRTTAPPYPAPFSANISLVMSVQDATENGPNQGIIATTAPAVFDGGSSGIAFDAGNAFRYGRLRLSNAHGSERLALSVPVRVEYFDGTIFKANTADNCSSFSLSSVLTFSNWQRNLNPGETTPSPATLTLVAGAAVITLSAPGVGNSGSVDLTLNVPAWLEFNWTGSVADPKARTTFGVYRGGTEMIYRREAY